MPIFKERDIYKIYSINESLNVLNKADKDTLVIFDIDDTLIMPKDKMPRITLEQN